jgi:hypothetical protein
MLCHILKLLNCAFTYWLISLIISEQLDILGLASMTSKFCWTESKDDYFPILQMHTFNILTTQNQILINSK